MADPGTLGGRGQAGMTAHTWDAGGRVAVMPVGEPGEEQELESPSRNGACQVLLPVSQGTLDEVGACSPDTQGV